ncbi:hypothetical protein OHC33_003661 [Knufia fluminis]|uniref:Zn(2)-C6 fungal-type domain-containing protein n=1 Tax=Knufia fluminis TaxID=191047 RepID=A0AAN8IPD2_9EURO|nr:hypothetical protein OHC33_003661 [Knufia fluminis]
MAKKVKVEHNLAEMGLKEELQNGLMEDKADSGSPKQPSKKKKVASTRRRTKTGCLTCRQRRVKCDETKPTCRNCEKSRRQCAGYQPTTIQRPHQVPQNLPMEHPFYQYQTPSGVSPGMHAQTPPSSLQHSQGGISSAFSEAQQQNTLGVAPPTTYNIAHAEHEWPYQSEYIFDDTARWSPGQGSWFSSREERLCIASAATSQTLLPITLDSANHTGPVEYLTASTRSRYYAPGEPEDPDGPWDVESDDDDFDTRDALVSFQSPRSLILDERMAYLLRHFCNILRPCISIFERPLAHDGSSTFGEKLPHLALSSRGLLHGLMAVSALHLAVLHHTSEVVPLKHFVIASKKLNKLLMSPKQRHNLETLSLCLLLAFYSVMLGDHAKWMMHLKGCSAFLMEHDFGGMAREVRHLRATLKAELSDCRGRNEHNNRCEHAPAAGLPQIMLRDQDWDLDEALIAKLTGLEINYAGQAQPSAQSAAQTSPTDDSIEEWRTKMDLLFWYLKMDVFQSTLSGDRLLLSYDKWRYFPPRGKIGSAESVYATMDHLLLVLGRLADFGAKDRVRKQQKITASGGNWTPDPQYFAMPQRRPTAERSFGPGHATLHTDTANRPSANEGRARAPRTSNNQTRSKRAPPMFYGMMPSPKIPPSMLSEFHIMDTELRRSSRSDMPKPRKSDDVGIEMQTKHALAEYLAIAEGLEIWEKSLNHEFEAWQPPALSTNAPFTPALRYADPTIACMWAFYHFGRILLRRYHPASPPAMMMSAAVNSPFTNEDAQAIGRINAGLLESQAELAKAGSTNPTLVAALQELTFPLMFAGVQYQDPAQRSWTIDNLLDVARDSGWKSAFSVASALETAWTAQGGYERTLKRRSPTDAKRYDAVLSASGDAAVTPEEQHENRFDSHDRRLIDRFSDLRAYWAIGVISTSDDIEQMLGQMKINSSS